MLSAFVSFVSAVYKFVEVLHFLYQDLGHAPDTKQSPTAEVYMEEVSSEEELGSSEEERWTSYGGEGGKEGQEEAKKGEEEATEGCPFQHTDGEGVGNKEIVREEPEAKGCPFKHTEL